MAKFNVLHADDVERWRIFVEDALAEECEVQSVNNCDDVLSRLDDGEFDLVVLDMLMGGSSPSANGLEVLEQVRQKYPKLPVVMFSGAWADTETSPDQLSQQHGASVVFKHEDEADAKLSEKVLELLRGQDS